MIKTYHPLISSKANSELKAENQDLLQLPDQASDKAVVVDISARPWKYEDIRYWINPVDQVCNATIEYRNKKARLRAGIIILKGDSILLGEEADEPGAFSLPGGGLNQGETPVEAAIREAQEEVYICVKNVIDTGCDYCECHSEVKDWVRQHVPEEEQWYHYYTCLCIGEYGSDFKGTVDKIDQDAAMKSSAKWYKLEDAEKDPSFKNQWRKAIAKYKHLQEDTRGQLISASRSTGAYKDQSRGKNRWERKRFSKVASQTQQFNNLDMNQFFKADLLEVKIPVSGETDNYLVTIQIDKICEEIAKNVKNNNNIFEYKCVIQALTKLFNTSNIRISCNCQDFCLHPDTKIKLLNGETVTIEKLESIVKTATNPVYLYSVDDAGDFKPGKIKDIWINGWVDHMLKVTLDNGKEIITTDDHPYMLRNGQYKPASELQVGQSLMPLYFSQTANGYETVKANSKATTEFYSTYKQVAQALLQKEIEDAKVRSGEAHIAIHHKDFNKNNNSPDNLLPMGVKEHYKYHYEHVFDSGAFDKFKTASEEYRKLVMDHTTPEYQKQAQVMSQAISNYWQNLSDEQRQLDSERKSNAFKKAWANGSYDTPARKAANERRKAMLHEPEMEARAKAGVQRYWANLSPEERKEVIRQRSQNLAKGAGWNRGKHLSDEDKLHKSQAALNRTPEEKAEHNRKIRDAKMLKVFNKMLEDKVALTAENYEKYRLSYFKYAPALNKGFTSIEEAVQYFKLNHKIIKIERIDYDMLQPVYDIEIEDYHNFYVDAGVILHNCYRFAHWSIVNNYGTADSAHDPGPGKGIANPKNELGKGCKHCLAVLNNQDFLMKVANVIRNYILYMSAHKQKLFNKFIFPKLYGMPVSAADEADLIDAETDLETSKDIIDDINKYARTKGLFKKGSNKNDAAGLNKLQGPKAEKSEE